MLIIRLLIFKFGVDILPFAKQKYPMRLMARRCPAGYKKNHII